MCPDLAQLVDHPIGMVTSLGAAAGSAADVAAHVPRLEELAVELQAAHPALATTLRELIDALGKAGI